MKRTKLHTMITLAASALVACAAFAPANAEAQETTERRGIMSWGFGLEGGLGVSNFMDSDTMSVTNAGLAWNVRATLGTRRMVAFEGAYIGATYDVETIGLDEDAYLVSNGLEAAARVHVADFNIADRGRLLPYVVGGLAWKHYNLANESFNTSNVRDSDDLAEIPLGLGASWRFGRLLLDQRFVFRPAIGGDLFGDDSDQSLGTWALTARGGFEF